MSSAPSRPKVYHITHVDNLPSILHAGVILSDATMVAQGGPIATIGMSSIKQRRLQLSVKCHAPDKVGDYVPFYFCPRSIMLYVIHRANHPELAFRGGQGPIVHLEADLHDVVAWAASNSRRWAFSLANAGAVYTSFLSDVGELDQVNWTAVSATDFSDPLVKEGKQAEFLVHGSFPWALVSSIGVHSAAVKARAEAAIAGASHCPNVVVRRDWYY
jgi:hypothetical protein